MIRLARRPVLGPLVAALLLAALVLPASLLSDRDVQRQLASGLTTTFVLVARQREGNARGAARMEIRFDPWDEVWLVRRMGIDGKEDRQRIASRELGVQMSIRRPRTMLPVSATRYSPL